MKNYLCLLILTVFVFTSCASDDEADIDYAAAVVGTYVGEYSEEDNSGSASIDDVVTTVERESSNEISVNMNLFLAQLNFNATMVDGTSFIVDEFTFFDYQLSGEGLLDGDELTIELIEVNDPELIISFVGQVE